MKKASPRLVTLAVALSFASLAIAAQVPDPRNIQNGLTIPDEGYCDQPYVVVTKDGNWLCTLTTGKGKEGQAGQHVVATISKDKGKTWSPLIDIEPADGPPASWAMPLIAPSGRIYVFYDYNGDRIDNINGKRISRTDMLGWYVYKYSDDHGRTWSDRRYRLPVRQTSMDDANDFGGKVQMLWGIGKPIIAGKSVYLGFSKIGKYVVNLSEGWFFRSDNILTEPDPAKHEWTMPPDGDIGLRSPDGPIAEEHNLVALSDGSLYTVYRTIEGYPCHAYSRDGGHTWTPPAYATYTPSGRRIKNPRACPRLWKAKNGNYLLWFHNHGGKGFEDRNPAWISGGIEKDGRMHWSEPEILFYDPDPEVRMSYPDLIEQDGRYWISETQKSIARVHEVDSTLLEGLWKQGRVKKAAERGLLSRLDGKSLREGKTAAPTLPDLRTGGGFSIEMWIEPGDNAPTSPFLDARGDAGRGWAIHVTEHGSVRVDLNDGKTKAGWDCDPGVLKPGRPHHVVAIVDGGPKIISFVADGALCDGGASRQYGWGRFPADLGHVNGSAALRSAPTGRRIKALRIYDRPLRISEAVANYLAGAP